MDYWTVLQPSDKKASPLNPQWTSADSGFEGERHSFTQKAKSPKHYECSDVSKNDIPAVNSRTELLSNSGVDIPEDDETEDIARQQWSSPVEFLLSCISMSVGLGNVWRFPMTAYQNGGGAFLIPYLIVLTFIGRPLYFLELVLGQFSSSGSVKVWKAVPAVKGIGFGQMIGTGSVVTYYCSLMALTVFYLAQSFKSVLPWTYCDPSWADLDCVDASASDHGNGSILANESHSSSEQYFYNYVLRKADNIEDGLGLPDWRLALCLLASWIILFCTLVKGVQSSGKVAYFTAVFPYVVLLGLLVRGVTLEGALDGIIYFFTPQWNKLLDLKVWYAAVTQAFFSLSVGFGSIITFSSYNSFHHNIYRDAWIISLADTVTSLLAGVTIFSILGHLAHQLGGDIKQVVRAGPGLAFISYPDVLAKFDWLPQLFAVLFFLMLFTLGVGTAAALTGNIITIVCDQFPSLRKSLVTLVTCVIGFLFGLVYITPGGQWILALVDYFGGGLIFYVLVIVEVSALVYIYGLSNLLHDVKFMLGVELGLYWKFCWAVFIPGSLTAILIYVLVNLELPTFEGESYPTIAYVCGSLLAASAVIMVPMGFLHALHVAKGDTLSEKWRAVWKPKMAWGPKMSKHRKAWETSLCHRRTTSTREQTTSMNIEIY